MRKIRVLLADDHKIVLEGLKSLLEPEFDLVGTVEDGRALVKEAERLNPDVVVADISMPLLNGIEAVRQIRKDPRLKETTVIAVTASVFEDFRNKVKESGFDGFLGKPLQAAELYREIKRLTNFEFIDQSNLREDPALNSINETLPITPALATEISEILKTGVDIGDAGAINELADRLIADSSVPSSLGREIKAKISVFDFSALKIIADRLERDRNEGENDGEE